MELVFPSFLKSHFELFGGIGGGERPHVVFGDESSDTETHHGCDERHATETSAHRPRDFSKAWNHLDSTRNSSS